LSCSPPLLITVIDVPAEEIHVAINVAINHDSDIVDARQKGRELAARIGFSGSDQILVATAISEVARNIVVYARRGEVLISVAERDGRPGVMVIARDDGPGIADVPSAMKDGYSTGNSLGLGLPGAKRLMDEFEITSDLGKGTTVVMRKWRR
jgi:serine/threonine-protein kinase RsbT